LQVRVLVSTLEGELGISDQTREYITTVSTIEKKSGISIFEMKDIAKHYFYVINHKSNFVTLIMWLFTIAQRNSSEAQDALWIICAGKHV